VKAQQVLGLQAATSGTIEIEIAIGIGIDVFGESFDIHKHGYDPDLVLAGVLTFWQSST